MDCPRPGTHGPRPVTTTQGGQTCRKKVGGGTLHLELTLDSDSGAPSGPRASPERLLSLPRNVTNLLHQGRVYPRAARVLVVARAFQKLEIRGDFLNKYLPRTTNLFNLSAPGASLCRTCSTWDILICIGSKFCADPAIPGTLMKTAIDPIHNSTLVCKTHRSPPLEPAAPLPAARSLPACAASTCHLIVPAASAGAPPTPQVHSSSTPSSR